MRYNYRATDLSSNDGIWTISNHFSELVLRFVFFMSKSRTRILNLPTHSQYRKAH